MPAVFEIDVRRLGGEISPLWFGHNLEHTRSCVSQGLSAQLVHNRKFAGLRRRSGVARLGLPLVWEGQQAPATQTRG